MKDWPISDDAIALVKEFEGLRLKAYRDPVGILTIGYGYTNRAGFGPGVKEGDVWTEAQAEDMLRQGMRIYARQIQPSFERRPNPDQFGAFVSLAYNIGPGKFINSTALRRWNAGDVAGSAEALKWFNKGGGDVLRGLVRRREAEAALILRDPVHPPRADWAPDPAEQPQGLWAAIVAALAAIFGGKK